ncbi:MAG: hypothetical protein FRX48_09450 [Lasallia pustulata]|uniref:Uncharacterized protein n=1 Tax=Lasallia pustulata TaxID=136370 RepID=A0A5M8PBR0_9LECA|nr:MAG: hypothetical protein FRX48_09450 [Lasallia pustulata]
MVKFWDSIPNHLRDWALEQQVFFTASAPCAGKHVNVSPKGLPATTFTIFDANHAAYIDATGSGIETVSHVYENGRVTVMFCSFGKSPRIMRFFCTGKVVEWNQPGFGPLLEKMGKRKVQGARAIILLNVFKVQSSCGFAVPFLTTTPAVGDEISAKDVQPELKDRETLGHWASEKLEKKQLRGYQAEWNSASLDGLVGLTVARRDRGEILWLTSTRAWVRRMSAQKDTVAIGMLLGILMVLLVQMAARQV